MHQRTLVVSLAALLCGSIASAAPRDWHEGTRKDSNGATRDFYNRAAHLAWRNKLGDWRDAAGKPQGNRAWAAAELTEDQEQAATFDVTPLAAAWQTGKQPNLGILLRVTQGGAVHFRSREHDAADQRPRLIVSAGGETHTLTAVADAYLDASTYRGFGDADRLRVSGNSQTALLRFDLSTLPKNARIEQATLRLHAFARYGGGKSTVGVFACDQGHDAPEVEPRQGLAAKYPNDEGIEAHPAVLLAARFEDDPWHKRWSFSGGRETLDPVEADKQHKFSPHAGRALRVKIAKGANAAMNVGYKFKQQTGREPEEIYFRYYLRLADDWNQTLQGGKMPGISGTYGVAGWGGRKVDGTNGWSARGAFERSIPAGNPLAGLHPIGTYCYHADQRGDYGDIWPWQIGYRGYLEQNRWYSVEQRLKLNTPGKQDGILQAWIDGRPAFDRRDIRFRTVNKLKIEQVWMNVYHGGKLASPHDQHLYIDNVVIAREYIGP